LVAAIEGVRRTLPTNGTSMRPTPSGT
jgi:hypothetical protein